MFVEMIGSSGLVKTRQTSSSEKKEKSNTNGEYLVTTKQTQRDTSSVQKQFKPSVEHCDGFRMRAACVCLRDHKEEEVMIIPSP
jgi:hypothetical protein